jgi:sugar lactone lactonase YvrE
VRLDRAGKKIASVNRDEGGNPLVGVNDLTRDGRGGVYFSASGPWDDGARVKAQGKVYYLTPDGKKAVPVAADLYYSNGVALSPDGKKLLVAESFAGQVIEFAIVGDDGRLTVGKVWERLADIRPNPEGMDWAAGPDGLKTDSHGNVYICQFGASRILVTKPDGAWLRTIPLPLQGVTNLAFGPGEQTLYVTAVNGSAEPYLGAVYEVPNR